MHRHIIPCLMVALLGLGGGVAAHATTKPENTLEQVLALDEKNVKEVTDIIGDNAEKELDKLEKKTKGIIDIIRDFIDRMITAMKEFFEKITN